VLDGEPDLLLLLRGGTFAAWLALLPGLLLLLRGGTFAAWLALLPGLLLLMMMLLLGGSDGMLAITLLLVLRPGVALGMLLMLACVMRSMRINWSSGKRHGSTDSSRKVRTCKWQFASGNAQGAWQPPLPYQQQRHTELYACQAGENTATTPVTCMCIPA
jgi:hypothetical protein